MIHSWPFGVRYFSTFREKGKVKTIERFSPALIQIIPACYLDPIELLLAIHPFVEPTDGRYIILG
jgi:hypothetical protein